MGKTWAFAALVKCFSCFSLRCWAAMTVKWHAWTASNVGQRVVHVQTCVIRLLKKYASIMKLSDSPPPFTISMAVEGLHKENCTSDLFAVSAGELTVGVQSKLSNFSCDTDIQYSEMELEVRINNINESLPSAGRAGNKRQVSDYEHLDWRRQSSWASAETVKFVILIPKVLLSWFWCCVVAAVLKIYNDFIESNYLFRGDTSSSLQLRCPEKNRTACVEWKHNEDWLMGLYECLWLSCCAHLHEVFCQRWLTSVLGASVAPCSSFPEPL